MCDRLARRLLVCAFLVGLTCLFAANADAAAAKTKSRKDESASGAAPKEWARFRGPNGDGITPEGDIDTKWNGPPKKLWTARVGDGYSTVVISDGRLFTMGNSGGKDTIYCLDVKDGKEIWKESYNCQGGQHPGPRATPTIDGKYVYTLSYEGHVYCLTTAKGEKGWVVDLRKEGYKPPTWGYAGSPLIDGNMVIVNVGYCGVGLDKDTGKILWKSDREKAGYATPVLFQHGGRKLMAIFNGKGLVIANPADGKKVCYSPWETAYDVNAADPIVSGDKIFISSGYGSACALLKFDGKSLTQVWKNDKLKCHFNTPVLWKGDLYGFHGNVGSRGDMKCMDFETGKVKWSYGGMGTGSLIIAGDKILALSSSGELAVAPISTERFDPISKARVLGERCWNIPVLFEGRIYIRNEKGELICLDVSK